MSLQTFAQEGSDDRVRKTTISPLPVSVLGKDFSNFDSDDAATVIRGWLIDALRNVAVFNVVSRDDMELMLGEEVLRDTGRAEDISIRDLVDVGKRAAVDYFIQGQITNHDDDTTNIVFELIDVQTSSLSDSREARAEIPFNPSLRSLRPAIERLVGEIAAQFPLEAEISELISEDTIAIAAGTADGLVPDLDVEVMGENGAILSTGFVVAVQPTSSFVRVELGRPPPIPGRDVARIKIVPPSQAALNLGTRHLQAGEYREALAACERGLEIDANGDLHACRARALYGLRLYEDSLASFGAALEWRPGDIQILEDYTRALFEAGEFTSIVAELSGQNLAEQSGSLATLLGMAYDQIGRNQQALSIYRATTRSRGSIPEALLRLALHSLWNDQSQEAEDVLQSAERLGRDVQEVTLAAAVYRGDSSGIALAEARGDFAALATAAEFALAAGTERWEESADLARRSEALNPSFTRARLLQARALAAAGRQPDAVELLNEALRERPDNFALNWLAAELLMLDADDARRQSNYSEVIARLQRAAELAAPLDRRPAERLGDVYMDQGQPLAAVGIYQDAIASAAASNASVPELHFKLGRAQALAGQYTRAVEPLELCIDLAPALGECHYYLGVSRYNLDQQDDAYRAFLAAEGQVPESQYYLALIHQERLEIDEALAAYENCMQTSEEFAEPCEEGRDALESITGQVVALEDAGTQAVLTVGSRHGVEHGMRGYVVGERLWVEVTQVQDDRSHGTVIGTRRDSALVGRAIRFRPTRPRGLSVQPGRRRGVEITWDANAESEVDRYIVYRSEQDGSDLGEEIRSVRATDEPVYEDRRVESGQTYYYSIVAENAQGERSAASVKRAIEVP